MRFKFFYISAFVGLATLTAWAQPKQGPNQESKDQSPAPTITEEGFEFMDEDEEVKTTADNPESETGSTTLSWLAKFAAYYWSETKSDKTPTKAPAPAVSNTPILEDNGNWLKWLIAGLYSAQKKGEVSESNENQTLPERQSSVEEKEELATNLEEAGLSDVIPDEYFASEEELSQEDINAEMLKMRVLYSENPDEVLKSAEAFAQTNQLNAKDQKAFLESVVTISLYIPRANTEPDDLKKQESLQSPIIPKPHGSTGGFLAWIFGGK